MRHLALALVVGFAGCQQGSVDLVAAAPPTQAAQVEPAPLPPLETPTAVTAGEPVETADAPATDCPSSEPALVRRTSHG